MGQIHGTAENVVLKQELKSLLLDMEHPIGSIWIGGKYEEPVVDFDSGEVIHAAGEPINPADLFGGTWEKQIVKKTIYGKADVENFEANTNHATAVTGLLSHKMSDTNYAINVTPYSSAAGAISCSAINVGKSEGYISSFEIRTNRTSTTAFSVFWTIEAESEFDQNGYYHWKRIEPTEVTE